MMNLPLSVDSNILSCRGVYSDYCRIHLAIGQDEAEHSVWFW